MSEPDEPLARALQGRRAGVVSRVVAVAVDLVVVVVIGYVLMAVGGAAKALFDGELEVLVPQGEVRGTLAGLLLVAYLALGWGLNGRTVGSVVLGLRVVGHDGADLSPVRGLARAVLYVVFPIGFAWVLVSRRNASLQDLLLDTAVVYDWGYGTSSATGPHPPAGARLRR
jgi:uncharacterized RDD family membrane protein YckC